MLETRWRAIKLRLSVTLISLCAAWLQCGGAHALTNCVDVVSAGADSTGKDDSTRVIQASLDKLVEGGCVRFGPGRYKISDKLSVPDVKNWTIFGEGRPNIVQVSDNKEIFYINSYHGGIGFTLKGFQLSWENLQNEQQTRAIAVSLARAKDRKIGGAYGFVISDLVVERGFRGISIGSDEVDSGVVFPIWGYAIENVSSFLLSGATVKLYSPGQAGSPRGLLSNIYIQSGRATEPSINIGKSTSIMLQNVEFNLGVGTQLLIQGNGQVIIDNLRAEAISASHDGSGIFQFDGPDQQVTIRNLEIQTLNVPSGIRAYIVVCTSGEVRITNVLTRDIRGQLQSVSLLRPIAPGAIIFGGSWSRKFDMISRLANNEDWSKIVFSDAINLIAEVPVGTREVRSIIAPKNSTLVTALCVVSGSDAALKIEIMLQGANFPPFQVPCTSGRAVKVPSLFRDARGDTFGILGQNQVRVGDLIEYRIISQASAPDSGIAHLLLTALPN